MTKQYKIFHTIQLNRLPTAFYDAAIGLYLLHMAIMAMLTSFYPDMLLRFRMSSFALVALLAVIAICSKFLRKQIPIRIFMFYLIYLAVILLSMVRSENIPYIKEYFVDGYFIKYVLLFALLFVYEEDPRTRIRQLTVVAVAALLVYQLGVSADFFLNEKGQFEYMTFGYGCAPWWVIVAQGIFYYKKWWAKAACLIVAVYFAAAIVNYGNRGASVVIAVTVGILLLVYLPLKQLVFFGTVCAAALLSLVVFLQPIMAFIGGVLGFDLSKSRNFRLLTINKLTYDSGRLPLIRQCLDGILHHPFLGMGIGGDRVITASHSYPHNIVIELCVGFGVIIGVLIYCWLVYIGIRALFYWHDRDWRALFLPFYVVIMVRLLFGGPLYTSGHLMASVIIYLSYTTYYSPTSSKGDKRGIKLFTKLSRVVKIADTND